MIDGLTDEENNCIRLFLKRANELRERRVIKDKFPGFSLSFKHENEELKFEENFPDEEDFRSLLLDLRTFVLNDEPNSFYHICNILYKKSNDEQFKEGVSLVRSKFRQALDQSSMIFKCNGVELNPEDILNYWLNGHYFHSDPEKEKQFKQMENVMPFLKYLLLFTVFHLIKCIIALSDILSIKLDDLSATDRIIRTTVETAPLRSAQLA